VHDGLAQDFFRYKKLTWSCLQEQANLLGSTVRGHGISRCRWAATTAISRALKERARYSPDSPRLGLDIAGEHLHGDVADIVLIHAGGVEDLADGAGLNSIISGGRGWFWGW
jgi:hypothetical protein